MSNLVSLSFITAMLCSSIDSAICPEHEYIHFKGSATPPYARYIHFHKVSV